jgi:hypothetical protein
MLRRYEAEEAVTGYQVPVAGPYIQAHLGNTARRILRKPEMRKKEAVKESQDAALKLPGTGNRPCFAEGFATACRHSFSGGARRSTRNLCHAPLPLQPRLCNL